MKHTHAIRLGLSALVALVPLAPAVAAAQTPGEAVFELRPHCVDADHAAANDTFGGEIPQIDGITVLTEGSVLPCPSYDVRDPLSKQTPVLKVGDTLDMDLVMHNPKKEPISRYRVWIGYDSNVLEGKTLELSKAFAVPVPGEGDFSSADNYIKVSATSTEPVKDEKVVLARITLTVKSAPANGTVLSYYDAAATDAAHTGAFAKDGEKERNVASAVQGALAVRFGGAASSSSVASVVPVVASAGSSTSSVAPVTSSAPATPSSSSVAATTSSKAPVSSSSSSSVAAVPLVFSKLQVQALRVTTEGSSAFLAWNPLPSAELNGYKLYYGSISGRYLQQRSVDKESQTVTLRALPVGMTYYFAVRAVNAAGDESDFSQEVAVTIGNPATSTSPLSGNLIDGPQGNAPYTDGTVSGESGPGSWVAAMVGLSAVLGTAFAFRRQWTASSALPR